MDRLGGGVRLLLALKNQTRQWLGELSPIRDVNASQKDRIFGYNIRGISTYHDGQESRIDL